MKTIKKKNTLFIFCLLLLGSLFCGCTYEGLEEEIIDEGVCVDEIQLDTLDLAPGSYDWFPYAGISIVVFKDEMGEKVNFEVKGDDTPYHTGYSFQKNCPENPIEQISYIYMRNTLYQYLQNESLNINLEFLLAPQLSIAYSDQYFDLLSYSIDEIASSSINASGNIVVDRRNYVGFYVLNSFNPLGDHLLLDQAFSGVFIKQNNSYEIYVNKEFGVIAFTDHQGKLWVFDSMY